VGALSLKLGKLRQLKFIDFSGNKLVGTLSSLLVGMKKRWEFSISSNKLVDDTLRFLFVS
jgi:hypothetical protein